MANGSNGLPLPFLREEALDRMGGDGNFLAELLALYDLEFEAAKSGLAEAIERRDGAQIRELGHSLKGSSASLCLPGLQEAAFSLEKAGEAGDIPAAQKASLRLEREYARLKAFLA